MQKITLQPNVPATLTLKFSGGKRVTSQITGEDQFLYTCAEGSLYASAQLAQAIDLEGGAGDTVEVIRRERRIGQQRRTDYVVRRLNQPDRAAVPAPVGDPFPSPIESRGEREARWQREDEQRRTAAAHAAAQAPPAEPQQPTHPTVPPMPADRPLSQREELRAAAPGLGNPLAQALCLAIDAAAIARDHARAKGLDLAWTAADVRAMANTLVIDAREARSR